MKVSVNWIKQYVGFELPPVQELVGKIGAQLGAVDTVIDIGAKYRGVVVARVVSAEQHPNADRLKVCRINDGGTTPDVNRGEDGLIQVVCGAPNVTADMLVAWLPPGSTVPESFDKEPFVLESRELRGVISNGMLASAKELAIGDSHEGIVAIDVEARLGQPFIEIYGLDDHIIDIENKMFTHRPDLFGQLGVAREIAGIMQQRFNGPDWYAVQPTLPEPEAHLPLEVRNELPELVPRFTAIAMSDIEVKPSPVWLQSYLSRVGLRPINNIVDLTNYYMLLTGQPLHAYDYDKVKALSGGEAATIIVRQPHQGEKIVLLNGKELEPRAEAIMIATDQKAVGLGGVMGGGETEVDEATKNIIFEAATFDMYSIRRTAMAHGLFTDAVTRFTKGQSPLQNVAVQAKIVEDTKHLAGGKVASQLIDATHVEQKMLKESVHSPVTISADFINTRLGLGLSAHEIKILLENVEFKVEISQRSEENQLPTTNYQLLIHSPFWRTDIEIPEDIVEEVGRLYGYDQLPLTLPKRSVTPSLRNQLLDTKAMIRIRMASMGANEVLTYSFVHGNLLDKAGQSREVAFQLSNALSPDLQYYRLSLLPSLLEKIHPNSKAGYNEFGLFELGKVHGTSETDDEGLPKELGRVAFVCAAEAKTAQQSYVGAPYYQARKYALNLLGQGARNISFSPLHNESFKDHALFQQLLQPFEPNRAALMYDGERIAGVVGEFRPQVRKALKLPDFCAGFELFLSAFTSKTSSNYVALPRFPKISQDISLKVAADLSYQELFQFVWNELGKVQPANTFPNLTPIDIYQREDDKDHKQITLRFTIASYEKTMRDEEVTNMLTAVAAAAKEKYGAEQV